MLLLLLLLLSSPSPSAALLPALLLLLFFLLADDDDEDEPLLSPLRCFFPGGCCFGFGVVMAAVLAEAVKAAGAKHSWSPRRRSSSLCSSDAAVTSIVAASIRLHYHNGVAASR